MTSLTFEQVINEASGGGPPAVLLGNGFSREWDEKRFCYESLLQDADLSERAYEVFQLFKTVDFEAAMRTLVLVRALLKKYPDTLELRKSINSDINELREALLKAIHKRHPEFPSDISLRQYHRCSLFLRSFSKIFTLNYDLLLYWVINHMLSGSKGCSFQDGFRKPQGQEHVLWIRERARGQNVFFIHGALHIIGTKPHPRKLTWGNSETIMTQLAKVLGSGKIPLFVAEGVAEAKLASILGNPYLQHCYKALQDNELPLVLFGTKLSEADEHIATAIAESNTPICYVAVRGATTSRRRDELQDRCAAMIAQRHRIKRSPKLEVKFYSAESARVWE